VCLLLSLLCHRGDLCAETRTNSTPIHFAARAQRLFMESQDRLRTQPVDAAAAWHFARAAFDWAEFATNDTQRAAIAHEAIAVSRPLIVREPKLAAAHYYLALNLGQLARTKTLGALKLVDEMEVRLKAARELDPQFDYAGPDRSLGLLYLDAPGWPASIGSRAKARQHLERAVELAPDFPENRLCLLEALLKWGERKNAERHAQGLPNLLKTARTNLTGEAWASAWMDWERRWEQVQKRLKTPPAARK
jgi:tetratricopeptide (TPR) repeat protein